MSEITCSACGGSFEGSRLAWCPTCLAARWLATPELVREKHDPAAVTNRLETYRSVITPRLKAELGDVLAHAAASGRWFWDRDYGMWVHVSERPLGRAPGVGIRPGRGEADHALDCLFVAEADSAEQAHVFAADGKRHQAQVRAGVFEPLGACTSAGCDNLRAPGQAHCAGHDDSTS